MQTRLFVGVARGLVIAVACLGTLMPANARGGTDPASDGTCQIEGVWEQVSVTFDGVEQPPHSRPMRKIVYRGHMIEIGTETGRGKIPQDTEVNRLRANETFGGASTYRVSNHVFTQHIDYFSYPDVEGVTLTGPCSTSGKLWRYSFSTVGIAGMEGWPKYVTEVFRRIK